MSTERYYVTSMHGKSVDNVHYFGIRFSEALAVLQGIQGNGCDGSETVRESILATNGLK